MSGKDYTFRTSKKKEFKAIEFVIGSPPTYEVKDNRGELKTSNGKQVGCIVMRVANPSGAPK